MTGISQPSVTVRIESASASGPEPGPGSTRTVTPISSGSTFLSGGDAIDLMLVLDASGSMTNWRDPDGIRCFDGPTPTCKMLHAWQREAALGLVNSLPGNASVGVVEFNVGANLLIGLTPVSTGLSGILDAINSADSDGNTNIGSGILAAHLELQASSLGVYEKHILVFSDGEPTDENFEQVEGTWEAETINAISGGTDKVHSIALPGASLEVMQGISTEGNGNFIDATNDLSVLNTLYS